MFKSRKNQCSYIIFLALFLFFNPILVPVGGINLVHT